MEYRSKRDIDEVLADVATALVAIEERLNEMEQRQYRHLYECPICSKQEALGGGEIKN